MYSIFSSILLKISLVMLKGIFENINFDSISIIDLTELLLKETSLINKFNHKETYIANIFKIIVVYFLFTLTQELKEKGVLHI